MPPLTKPKLIRPKALERGRWCKNRPHNISLSPFVVRCHGERKFKCKFRHCSKTGRKASAKTPWSPFNPHLHKKYCILFAIVRASLFGNLSNPSCIIGVKEESKSVRCIGANDLPGSGDGRDCGSGGPEGVSSGGFLCCTRIRVRKGVRRREFYVLYAQDRRTGDGPVSEAKFWV